MRDIGRGVKDGGRGAGCGGGGWGVGEENEGWGWGCGTIFWEIFGRRASIFGFTQLERAHSRLGDGGN